MGGKFSELLLYSIGILILYVWIMADRAPMWALDLFERGHGILWR